ncbi:hypothetical protein AWENTII_000881 [Aspergillus wentii]
MAHSTACYLPKFGSALNASKRPVSTRAKTTAAQNSQLVSAWNQGELSSLLQAAWALVLHHYTGNEDISFGYQPDAPSPDSATPSNTANLSTVGITIDEDDSIRSVVGKVKESATERNGDDTISGAQDLNLDHYNTILMLRNCSNSSQNASLFSCRLRLHVKVLQQSVGIFLESWNHDTSTEQVKSIAGLFEQFLAKILSGDDTVLISDINSFSERDWRRISKWNASIPETHDYCLHDAIKEHASIRPDEEAICAWDGSVTFAELDRMASKIACHLQMRGVGPEVRVGLCFDKSKWYSIAMLGVLKAGGAFVPLDPTHPTSRLQALVKSVEAKVILCSENRAEYLKTISDALTPLGDNALDALPVPSDRAEPLPGVKSSNAAYVLFTSGSTGEPKGTLIEHRAFSSSARAHGARFDLIPGTRCIQFAAHTFDASIIDIITVLMHGAVVCVPSEEARINDITTAMNEMRVNSASLTPSFVGFIDPEDVPGLEILVLAGEAMSPSHLETWSKINLINAYGPTEASVAAAINTHLTPESDCRDIGSPVGARIWLVNPKDHNQLVPVGCPGEMLLEGPTLARCYVNNQQKTDDAFIYDPAWAKTDGSTTPRRFYKTGDLARYNSDKGTLAYVGRKDTQIKFHGQRVELGEIESHLSTDPSVKHSLVLLPKTGFANGKLVAITSLKNQTGDVEALKLVQQSRKSDFVPEARERLASRLPGYMVPGVWLCVETLPMLASGKLDRKTIANWVGSMETDPDLQASGPVSNPGGSLPANSVEDQLISIWSRVLNIPKTHLDMHASFLSQGGDSIAAITCMGHCKKQGIALTVDDVLRSKSIKELAARAKTIDSQIVYEETVEQRFDLSPIQKLHFLVRKEGQGHFNQGILTRLNKQINEADLLRAVETLITRHSMLRARFTENGEGSIQQRVTDDITGSYRWRVHNVSSQEQVEQAVAESQSSINSFVGPLLTVDLLHMDGDSSPLLSMVAHHLVVDIVSWRIILEDLEDLLLNPQESASQNCSLPFQAWCRLQAEQIQTLNAQNAISLEQIPAPDFAFWGIENRPINYGDVDCEGFEIDEETTSLIMMQCHESLQTEPIDLFLAMLLHSFGQTFTNRSLPVIHNEGHGREPWDSSIDISRTVGWFTTLYPVSVPAIVSNDPAEAVMRVKDIRRAVSDNGRQYFANRVLTDGEDGTCQHHRPMEISFNYVGQHRDLQRKDGLFQLVQQMAGETGRGGGAADFGAETPRFALFEISAMVVKDRIRFIFSFNRFMEHQQTIREWISCCQGMLKSAAEQMQSLAPRPTLSSFPMLSLTYGDLDTMLAKKLPSIGVESLDLIEDIYPCSFMQQGILLSRSKDSSLYAVHDTLEVKGMGRHKPDLDRLTLAWQKVVSHHAMLRTVIVENLTSKDLFSQVVFKSFDSPPAFIQCVNDSDVLSAFDSQEPTDYNQNCPSHRLTICQTAAGKLFVRLELSHAVMDGTSISIILRDLQLAYSSKLEKYPKPLFKNFMRYLQDTPQKPSMDYWCSYLQGIKPCHMPVLNDGKDVTNSLRSIRLNFGSYRKLQKICEATGTTLSTAFNAAWGLTLRSFCDSDDVCFSYMVSLRDVPVEEIEWMVGPTINIMACRMNASGNSLLKDVLHQVHNDYVESLPYRTASLIDIQHTLKLSDTKLFNSGVSYRKLPPKNSSGRNSEIEFSEIGSIYDPAEASVFVNIEVAETDAQIELNYWTTALSDGQAENVASVFIQALNNIIDHQDQEIGRLDALSQTHKAQIAAWNSHMAQAVDYCIQDIFDEKAQLQPAASAIITSDSEFSYSQVNELSSCLASYLAMVGVAEGSLVPISFDKSAWAVISMLAVLKAGGVCVPRDTAQSQDALDEWLVDNDVQVALASPHRAQSLEGMFPYVIPVGESLFKYLPATEGISYHSSQPSDIAYVVYTTGSSGEPKGVVLDHSAVLTRAEAFASSLGMDKATKMFQFASYTSDMFLQEVFGTFMNGGCICVPSGNDLKHLATSINKLRANSISLSPSIASRLQPSDVPQVQTIALSGERTTRRTRDAWGAKVRFHTLYGASECSSSAIHNSDSGVINATQKIGSSVGCINWLADPSNHNILVPVGCVGEILIEGPVLARGYFGDGDDVEGDFIEDPTWISDFPCEEVDGSRRLFKTGDLARYNSDGSLVYVGKKGKGTQSELLIDTWQVANRIDTFLPSNNHCAVESITCDGNRYLVAFVLETGYSMSMETKGFIQPSSPRFHELASRLHTHLMSYLPSDIVPSIYIPISSMPLTPLGKLNHQAFREEFQNLSVSTRLEFDIEKCNEFWRSALANSKSSPFPSLPTESYAVSATGKLERNIQVSWPGAITSNEEGPRSAIFAAWALTLSSFTGSHDVTFGERFAGVPAIPRRFNLEGQLTVSEFLKKTHEHLLAAAPYEKAGLQRIKSLSADAARACKFNNVLSVFETKDSLNADSTLKETARAYPLAVACTIDESEIQLKISYDQKVLPASRAERITTQFVNCIKYFGSNLDEKVTIGEMDCLKNSFATHMAYWKESLANIEPCIFPSLHHGATESKFDTTKVVLRRGAEIYAFCQRTEMSPSLLFQVVWGLVLRCYVGALDVCFGYYSSDKETASEVDAEKPMDVLVCKSHLEDCMKLEEVLQKSQADSDKMAAHPIPLTEIQDELGLQGTALFNTVLNYRELSDSNVADKLDPSFYAIVVNAQASETSAEIDFGYSTGSFSKANISNIADGFEQIVHSIIDCNPGLSVIGDLEFIGDRGCEQVREWNATLPERVERCAHEIIQEQASRSPLVAPAICSWDANFTYTQLDTISSRLAHHVAALGVKPETFVALCFEKSAWAIVCQLAVLKAGGAFAMLDPTHPEARLKAMIEDLGSSIVLCSEKYQEKAAEIADIPFVVSENTVNQLSDLQPTSPFVAPTPSNAAYAIFTSGTTGKPKVVVIEHGSLSSLSIHNRTGFGFYSGTRSLQFSSYTFDVCILETIVVLMTGGCICVPSEEERMNDIVGAIRRMEADFFTAPASIICTVNPKDVPTIRTVVMGGEKMMPAHLEHWSERRVMNSYGPAEATVWVTIDWKSDLDGNRLNNDCNTIGRGVTGRTWVVDPHNVNRLLPIGAVGELVVEGPGVSRGYLNNEQKTKEAFIESPEWTRHSSLQSIFVRKDRMYRTGDLVRCNPDGTIAFVSRKDTQVKINGQRIELEEIEYQCARCLPEGAQAAIEIVVPETKAVAKAVAAFFTVDERELREDTVREGADGQLLLPMSESMFTIVKELQNSLADVLPSVMIPKMFFPVRRLPYTSSGKMDRKGLRGMVQSLSKDQLRPYMTFSAGSTQVSDEGIEGQLRGLWEEVLDLTPGSINAEDSFFGLGGDSFSAMKLVGAAQSHGISLKVADMFKYPIFMDMAKQCDTSGAAGTKPIVIKPFSLLPASAPVEQILEEVVEECEVPRESIIDAYPCSPVQEGLITLSVKQRGAYIAQPLFRLAQSVDLDRFKAAWQQTVNELDILRTRIVHTDSAKFVQAVLDEAPISWLSAKSVEELPADMVDLPKHNGGSLTAYAIIESKPLDSRYFVWTVHHALYDGWSVPLVLKKVEENYLGSLPKSPVASYGLFIDYLLKRDAIQSDDFWKSYLSNPTSSQFPQNTNSMPNAVRAGNSHHRSIELSRLTNGVDLTMPELIRAAWAIVVSIHTGSGDVSFGETLMGRNIDLPSVSDVTGPVLTTVPTRIQHSGLQHIRKLSKDTAFACEFQNLLVIQADDSQSEDALWVTEENRTTREFFTHPLVVECKLGKSGVTTTVHHDELVLNSWLAQKLADQFSFVLKQLAAIPKGDIRKLGELDVFCPQDREEVSLWNGHEPVRDDRCLHDIIEGKYLLRPNAPAVCSWDGDLTYRELFETASSFAAYLRSRGVGPEVLVPVCLDKSVWAIVTIISILIAGGAFVPMDPVHPTSRHEEILGEVNAKLVLCTPKYSNRYANAAKIIIPVSKETIKAYGALTTNATNFTRATPTNAAYAIFTSGSTGRAKGIIIDHFALASSAKAFGPIVDLDEKSRIFQFASLTFDAAVMEVLATLMYGGCVCVPSEDERLNDVAGAIRRMKVTWSFMTPSIASIIEPSSVPTLKILVVGGEKMSQEVITKWADSLKLVNAYGPTETSVFATLNTEVYRQRDPAAIGPGIPSTLTWIVDADNHDRLTPVGAVGELVLEGATLAREYLKNPAKTAEAFVNDPAWTSSFPSSMPLPRRIYKTGDLVKYRPDGGLDIIGRKDHQVKLHGQRMELTEIEHRLYEDNRVRHAVVIMPKTGPLKHRLVTVLSMNSISTGKSLMSVDTCELVSEAELKKSAYGELVEIQKSLETQLPIYMVPQTWAVIKKLPMLVSGKLDRKKITFWLENIEEELYERIMQDYDKIKRSQVEPSTKEDRGAVADALQDIFAQVLNVPSHKVDLNRSFVSLGGDSITGMSVVSRARKQGFKLALNDVLQSNSITELAKKAGAPAPVVNNKEKTGEYFGLSPIQDLYCKYSSSFKGVGRFNQSMTLRVTRNIESETVRTAIKAVVNQHSMFRARFSKSKDGKWRQKITNDVESSYQFRVHSVNDSQEIVQHIAESQWCLDIMKGPVFAADFFNIPGQDQVLFLVANHLCVDMVSWRIALQDIQDVIETGSLSPEKPLSFQRWSELQLEDSKKEESRGQLPFKVEAPNLKYWGMEGARNVYGNIKIDSFTLDEQATSFILGCCHETFRTETIEVLLTAIIHSFRCVFTDRKVPTIYNEGHGREVWDSNIDLSRTVGWFTTVCPFNVDEDSVDIFDTLKRVKDTRRKISDNGRSHFAHSLLNPKSQNSSDFPVPFEAVFNYLGRLQQLERDDSLFQHFGAPFSGKDFESAGDMGADTIRFALLEISAIVIKEKLHVSFTYNKNMQRQGQINQWISECKRILEQDMLCVKDVVPEPTLSDYPLLPITYDGLRTLVRNTFPKVGIESKNQVEDIYPCSPMQEGILLSQIREPGAYMFHIILEVKSNAGKLDPKRLRAAWGMVVARHPILRTVFIDSNYKGGSFDQLVIKDLKDNVLEFGCGDLGALGKLEAVKLREINAQKVSKLPQQVTICKTTSGKVFVKIEMNHAIVDGGSVDLLLRDWTLAYNGQLPEEPGPLFSDYIKYIGNLNEREALSHWTKYLRGVRPCHLTFPDETKSIRQQKSVMMAFNRFPELQKFCEKTSVTLANLTLSAWAIVLRAFTGSNDICFGYPSTGRDSPVPGIQDAVGIFINMLCCRVKFTAGQTIADISKMVQDDYIRGLSHQSCSLAAIQHNLGCQGQTLFNTTISIQNRSASGSPKDESISFDVTKAFDPTEYPMTVNVETGRNREGVLLRYWTDSVSDQQAKDLADSIARVFTSFIEKPSTLVSQLELSGGAQSNAVLPMDGLALDNDTFNKLIENRVYEVIGQMLRDGKLALPSADNTESNDVVNDLVQVKNMSQQRDLTDSTLTLTAGNKKSAEYEGKLWALWSSALGLSSEKINRQGSFFKLGGDSITAMKMVGAAREEGLGLTVADVFNSPVFEDMLEIVCAAASSSSSDTEVQSQPDQADSADESDTAENEKIAHNEGLLAESVRSRSISVVKPVGLDDASLQLGICPKIGVFRGGIADVLPVTDFQALSLTATLFKSRWMLNYFFLEGSGPLDMKRLRESFVRLVDTFDILRTVFVCFHGQFFQVVLRKIKPTIVVDETDKTLDEYTEALQQRDRQEDPRQGEQYVQFYVVKQKKTDKHRILIRLSHAQFDGVCLAKIMSAIKLGYEGRSLPPISSFANYMRLLPGTITPEHYDHWTSLLQGCKMTELIRRPVANTFQHIGSYAEARKMVEIPTNALGNITIATVMQAAWAMTLAKLSAQSDVVFGLTISGRNATVPGVEATIGPCVNSVPVRVNFGERWTGLDLCRYVQDQRVASMPFESLGFREIIRQCTDWPDWTYFTSSVFHQNVDYEGQIQLEDDTFRMGGLGVIDNFSDFTLVSKSIDERNLAVSLGYSSNSPISQEFATKILDMACETAQSLVANPNSVLPSPSTLRSLRPQVVDDIPRMSDQIFLSSQLKDRSMAELLVNSEILAQVWQQVLPNQSADPHQTTFHFDASFFELGGDIFNMAQVVWLLEQEGLRVRIEDLLEHSTFLGQLAVLALRNGTSRQEISDNKEKTSASMKSLNDRPVTSKSENVSSLSKAFNLARRITTRWSTASPRPST